MKTKNKTTANIKSPPYKRIRRFIFTTQLLLCFAPAHSQTIPTNFFGINYWMPDKIPVGSGYPGGFAQCANSQTQVMDAGVTLVRIGGGNSTDGYDKYGTDWTGTTASNNCYIAAITAVKTVNTNAKFLIQVPFSSGITAAQAGTMVQNIKIAYPFEVFYYSIGNEWDRYTKPGTSPARGYYASEIASLIQSYSTTMKAADPTIKIVAPALSYYGALDGNSPAVKIMPILISGNGTASDITGLIPGQSYYYVDVVDYHTYAGGNGGDMSAVGSGSNYTTYRSNSIAYPGGQLTTDLSSGTGDLQALLQNANTYYSRTGSNALTYAITEMNIDWKNPPTPVEGDPLTNSTIGLGPRSFFAGQYLVDMFAAILKNGTNTSNAQVAFVNPWSINESSGDGSTYDLSMTKGVMTTCSDPAPQPLSTYWHYQMVANNFSGTYLPDVSGTLSSTGHKAFAYETSSEIGVLILNQAEQSPRGSDNSTETFYVNFNNSTPSSGAMNFAFAGSCSVTWTGSGGGLSSGTYNCAIQKEASMFLAFDRTTGQLTKNEVYTLQDALRPNDIGPNSWLGGTENVNAQLIYNNHVSTNIYTDINILPPTTGITAASDKVFQFTNSAKIDGATNNGTFSSGTTGKTLCIIHTDETTCH